MRKSLASWIRTELTQIGERKERCTAFAVLHYQGAVGTELKTVQLGSKEWDAKELEDIFIDIAETHAGGLVGVQQYQVLSFFEGSNQPQGKYPMRVSAQSEESMGGLSTEGPTPQGHMMQMMRHNEAHMRAAFVHHEAMTDRMLTMIDRQGVMIEKLMEENHDAVELAKVCIMTKAEDAHTKTMEVMRLQRNGDLVKQFAKYAPSILNTITGREIVPQSTADTTLIEGLVEEMSADQALQFMSILTDKQKAIIVPRMQQIAEKQALEKAAEEKRTAQSQELINGHPAT
jgi:hypothetical protein